MLTTSYPSYIDAASKQEKSFVYNDDVGSLEDEEEKLLAEEVKTQQFITDLGKLP